MKTGLMIVGVLALLCGVVWFAQGAGYFPYPRSSFMINQTPWVYIGLAVAAAGAVAIVAALKL
jgi:hypothetical protein